MDVLVKCFEVYYKAYPKVTKTFLSQSVTIIYILHPAATRNFCNLTFWITLAPTLKALAKYTLINFSIKVTQCSCYTAATVRRKDLILNK